MPDALLSSSQTVHPNNEQNAVPTLNYSEAAKKYIAFRRRRMVAARDMRDQPRHEFDDLSFLKYYDLLKKADDQYVAPRKNKQDISINTGTIRDKDTSLVEYAMKYDFEPVAQVFDDSDTMLEDLAEAGEDLVRKSLMIEEFRDKAKLIYRSMVSFGTALVEDKHIERWEVVKEYGKGAAIGSQDFKWTERRTKAFDGFISKLWDLRKCYFGDINKFFMNGPEGQPFFFAAEYVPYDVAQAFFGDWDRWQYVQNIVQYTPELSGTTVYAQTWTLNQLAANYVEIIWYFDPVANEFAITLNGVDMLPIQEKKTTDNGVEKTLISGFPLTAVSPSGAIPFAKYDLEPMHDFAYSKSQPGKMRVWADVENMIVKLMIGAFKQRVRPTLGNKSGKQFGEEVTDPATIINDIQEGDIFPILPNFQGSQSEDMGLFEMVKKELDKNSIERTFQGMDNPQPQDDTATKTLSDMKAQSLKLAALFDGIISGNKQLYWLRTFNIIAHWTRPQDAQVDTVSKQLNLTYRTIHVPAEIEGGQKAMKRIVFTKGISKDSGDVHQQELDHKKATGNEVRISYIDPDMLAAARLKWYYDSVPVPNDSDPLSYMIFAKQVNDAAQWFGVESLAVQKLKHRFAKLTGNDFDTWFISQQELDQKKAQIAPQAPGAPTPGAPSPIAPNQAPPAPTITSAAQGAVPNIGVTMR